MMSGAFDAGAGVVDRSEGEQHAARSDVADIGGALWPILKANPIGTSVVTVISILVSFIPTALLNIANCGSWSGLNLESKGMDMHNPLVGLVGEIPC